MPGLSPTVVKEMLRSLDLDLQETELAEVTDELNALLDVLRELDSVSQGQDDSPFSLPSLHEDQS